MEKEIYGILAERDSGRDASICRTGNAEHSG